MLSFMRTHETLCRMHPEDRDADGDAGEAEDQRVALHEAERKRALAAIRLSRAIILSDERRRRLVEGIHDVVGEDLEIVCGRRTA